MMFVEDLIWLSTKTNCTFYLLEHKRFFKVSNPFEATFLSITIEQIQIKRPEISIKDKITQ